MSNGCSWLYRLCFAFALTATSACSDHLVPAGSDGSDRGVVGTETQELGTGSRCDTAPADLVWNGGGFVRTNANYTAHNASADCWDAYLIDLNNYDPKYTKGTQMNYGRTVPRDEAACRRTSIKGHFWRKNANGTTTYLGVASKRGRWITGSNLPPRCEVPSFVVEREIPSYAPGASYRLALTAREDRATDGYDRREIVIGTRLPDLGVTGYQVDERMRKLQTELSATTVHPAVAKYFARRGTPAGAMNCRVAQLELSVLRISQGTTFVQAGATAETAKKAVDRYADLVGGLCGSGSLTALQFQNLLRGYILDFTNMKKEIWNFMGMSRADASAMLASAMGWDWSRIAAGCGTDMVEFYDFIRTGAAPAGIAGPNVLLRNCSGSPSQVGNRLGMTVTASPIRASIKSCILEAFDEPSVEQQAGVCSDPRATGGSGECPGNCHATPSPTDPCVIDPMSDACFEQQAEDTGLEFNNDPDFQLESLSNWLLADAYNEAKNNYTQTSADMDRHLLIAQEHTATARQWDEYSEWASIGGDISEEMRKPEEEGTWTDDVLNYGAKAARAMAKRYFVMAEEERLEAERLRQRLNELEAERQRELEKLCQKVPTHVECTKPSTPPADPAKRCPETDLGTGPVWFDQQNGMQLTVADRIQDCTCEAMRRGAFTISGGGTSNLMCMTESERRVFDCQTNPWDEDDGGPNPLLRPECRNAFQPGGLDRDALLVGACAATRCTDEQFPVGAFGRCVCVDNPTPANLATVCNFNGPAGRLDCGPTGGSLVCDEMGPRCVDTGAGRTPFGNNPLCQLRGRDIQLGARPVWGEATPNSFYTSLTRVQSTTRMANMMKPGFMMLAGPANFERTYDEVGSDLVVEVNQPGVLPPDRGSVQGYCSNEEAGVFNVFLGQRELGPGMNIARFPFDPRCWGDGTSGMNVGVAVRTAANQAERAAFLGYRFDGIVRAVANPVEPCDDGPDPAPPILDPGLLVDLFRGNIRPGIIEGTWSRDIALGSSSLDSRLTPVDRAVFFQ